MKRKRLSGALVRLLEHDVWDKLRDELNERCSPAGIQALTPLLSIHRASVERLLGTFYGNDAATLEALAHEPVAYHVLMAVCAIGRAQQEPTNEGAAKYDIEVTARALLVDDRELAKAYFDDEVSGSPHLVAAYLSRIDYGHPYANAYWQVLFDIDVEGSMPTEQFNGEPMNEQTTELYVQFRRRYFNDWLDKLASELFEVTTVHSSWCDSDRRASAWNKGTRQLYRFALPLGAGVTKQLQDANNDAR
jgi:hypothetical protein